jgi:1,5-anhydro-D-fructose reductase (1,5-anhydro-D-mannitol-forming)
VAEPAGKIRWAVAGLGNVVTGRFAPALARSNRSVLTACATRNPEAAKPFADKHALSRLYASFDELVKDPDIDVVYLATPNSLHYPQARQALLAGKHVLCEKPLALTVDHGSEMIDIANGAKKLLKVAYQVRFERLFERVREHIRSGGLGELRSVRLFGCSPSAARPAGWRQNPDEGGILTDLAVHFLDLVPWLTGLEFSDISARANPADIAASSVQTITILGTLGSACHGVIAASRETPQGQNALAVEGTKGAVYCTAWRGAPEFELVFDAAGRRSETFAPSAIFEREIEAFENEIDGRSSSLATGEDGIRTIILADAVRQSARSGKAVLVGAPARHNAP